MTYLQFHFVFILPPILLLAWLTRAQLRGRARWALPLMSLIALAWATPWDNYLVYRGIWMYGDGRVMGIIGYVPIEEYLFFLLQPLLTGLWVLFTAGTDNDNGNGFELDFKFKFRIIGGMFYGVASILGLVMLFFPRFLYAGLILVWAAPVLLGQWLLIGSWLGARARLFARCVIWPTLYLWVADRIAIGLGIWSISPRYTTGAHLFGLPVEEALFFLATNLLVVQGILLFLQPAQVKLPRRETVTA